jgi:hypothetical protein
MQRRGNHGHRDTTTPMTRLQAIGHDGEEFRIPTDIDQVARSSTSPCRTRYDDGYLGAERQWTRRRRTGSIRSTGRPGTASQRPNRPTTN